MPLRAHVRSTDRPRISNRETDRPSDLPPAPPEPALDPAELRRRVARVDWWHTIHLGHGVVTPGRGDSGWRLAHMGLPEDLSGRTVLDIGTWDGLFAFEAERRGAERVVALDDWRHPGFDVAREALGSRVEHVEMDVRQLTPDALGLFDLVLFMGVLYHVPDPVTALARVASVTREHLILETDTALHHLAEPAAELRVRRGLDDTSQNWWIPNPAALDRMLTTTGFRRSEVVTPPVPPARSLVEHVARRLRLDRRPETTRTVVHAWK